MSSSKVVSREVREDDYAAVHTLRASVGMGDKDSPALWQRLFFKNPALKRHPGHWPLGWVLEAAGEIVGYIGNIPQVYVSGYNLAKAVDNTDERLIHFGSCDADGVQ